MAESIKIQKVNSSPLQNSNASNEGDLKVRAASSEPLEKEEFLARPLNGKFLNIDIEIQPGDESERLLGSPHRKRVTGQFHSQKWIETICFAILLILGIALFFFQYIMPLAVMAIHFGSGVVDSVDLERGILGISRNLDALPISDVTFGSTCPSDYEIANLGSWQGSFPFCSHSESRETKHDASKCPFFSNGISSKEYTVWKNSKLCVKRITRVSNSSLLCPAGSVKCYPGVCVEGTDCGITEIRIEDAFRNDTGWYSTYYNNFYVNYRKDTGAAPIVSFAVVHGKPGLCLNPSEFYFQHNHSAMGFQANGCGRYGSLKNTTQLDSDSSINIINCQHWDPVPAEILREAENETGYLVAIPRLALKDAPPCLTFNLQFFLNSLDFINNSRKLTSGFIALIMALLIVGTILIGKYLIAGQDKKAIFHGAFIFALIAILTTIPAAMTITQGNADLNAFQQQLTSMKDSKCFVESGSQQVITDFMTTSLTTIEVTLTWLVYSIVNWIGPIVVGVGIWYGRAVWKW